MGCHITAPLPAFLLAGTEVASDTVVEVATVEIDFGR
jgi:hypothetical protein